FGRSCRPQQTAPAAGARWPPGTVRKRRVRRCQPGAAASPAPERAGGRRQQTAGSSVVPPSTNGVFGRRPARRLPRPTRQPPAGGMNPWACAARAREALGRAGLPARAVALVRGDDLLPRLDELLDRGHPLAHLDTGEPLRAVRDRVVSANAYLGSPPIAEALA